MKNHTDVNTKSGVTLDFIVYAVAANTPLNIYGVSGFFFQDYQVINRAENYSNNAQIMNNIEIHCKDFSEENKKKYFRYALQDVFAYNWKDLDYEKQSFSEVIKNYFEYLNEFINLDEIILNDSDYVDFNEINTISELYSAKEIEEILFEVNYYLTEYGFDHEEENSDFTEENYRINLSALQEDFEDFISLRYIFPNSYIGYYASQILFFEQKGNNKLIRFIREINGLINSPMLNEISNDVKFLETLISKNELLFYKHSFDTPQIDGFFDEFAPYIMFYDTLWNYLNILKNSNIYQFIYLNDIYQYKYIDLDDEHCLYGMKLKYLRLKLYGENEDPEEENLSDNFNYFIKAKNNFIQYLNEKGFTTREINIILNILSENKYSTLDIRSLNTERDIYFFRICYFFYVFDYFTEVEGIVFDSISSFASIIKFNPQNKRENKQQFLKNYSNINNSDNKDYPFTSKKTELFLSEIENSLGINREKLKLIPRHKNY